MQPSGGKYYGAAANYNRNNMSAANKLLKIGALIIGVIVLVSIIFTTINIITNAPKDNAAKLVQRTRVLMNFVFNNQKNITSDTLQTINGNISSLLTSDYYALQQALRTNYGVATIPDTIIKTETDTTSAGQLSNAQVQSRFDQTYLQLLRDKITATEELANQMVTAVGGNFKPAIQTMLDHLHDVDSKLEKLKL